MKKKMKMENRSDGYGINRPRARRGHKYNKHKKWLRMMMFMCTKQHLSKVWSLMHEKVKQHY